MNQIGNEIQGLRWSLEIHIKRFSLKTRHKVEFKSKKHKLEMSVSRSFQRMEKFDK